MAGLKLNRKQLEVLLERVLEREGVGAGKRANNISEDVLKLLRRFDKPPIKKMSELENVVSSEARTQALGFPVKHIERLPEEEAWKKFQQAPEQYRYHKVRPASHHYLSNAGDPNEIAKGIASERFRFTNPAQGRLSEIADMATQERAKPGFHPTAEDILKPDTAEHVKGKVLKGVQAEVIWKRHIRGQKGTAIRNRWAKIYRGSQAKHLTKNPHTYFNMFYAKWLEQERLGDPERKYLRRRYPRESAFMDDLNAVIAASYHQPEKEVREIAKDLFSRKRLKAVAPLAPLVPIGIGAGAGANQAAPRQRERTDRYDEFMRSLNGGQ